MDQKQPVLSVRDLHKKFSRDIKYNLLYGVKDLSASLVGLSTNYMQLRKKEFWALSGLNFDLYENEILGVVGANGSGKTTLMRILSDIYPLDYGEVCGKPGQKITALFALKSGMQGLFTGRENIYIKGSMYGMSKKEIDEKIDFIKEFSELGESLESPFGNYSSGMKARLAYSIALATEPDIFIVDEALAVGDSIFKAKCFDHMKEYAQQKSRGILLVSNNVRKILKVATRVLVMEKGNIILNSTDVREALIFYIKNCLNHLETDEMEKELKKVIDYDM